MPGSQKTLIFFTDSFPFGTSETFIENEFPFLVNSFEKIIIVTTNLTDAKTRKTPDNIEIVRIPYKPSFKFKVLSLLSYFNPIIQREIGFIKEEFLLKANKDILSVLLASYAKALEVNALLNMLVLKHQIDLKGLYLYCYWMNDITPGVALFKNKNPEINAMCRAHRWDVYFETQTPPYLPLRNFIIESLDVVYCISQDAYGYLQRLTNGRATAHLKISRLGTFNRDKIVTMPNEGMMRIISCSNLIPLKRVHLIIEALALIDNIKIDWKHFGKGPLEAELKALAAQKLSAKTNIEYAFMGQISNMELLEFYKKNNVDLFINVSETEGIPVSIIEASSFGVVVIGTLVGGVGEILEEGENGFLVNQSCTPQEVANAITRFYDMPDAQKSHMRAKAIIIWQQKYSAENNYTDFLTSLMNLGSAEEVNLN
jgi:glycosyltransferase involved in cell wall biosynthesis